MMGRVWIVALAIVARALRAAARTTAIMAAALVLAAFTVYFVMSFVTREDPLPAARRRAQREAEHLMSARRRPRAPRRPGSMHATEAGRAEPGKIQRQTKRC